MGCVAAAWVLGDIKSVAGAQQITHYYKSAAPMVFKANWPDPST